MSKRPHTRRAAARLLSAVRWGPLLIAMAGGASSASAQSQCPPGPAPSTLWSDREASIRQQEQVPDACLKSLVRQCDADAEAGFLDAGSAALCSVRYEALLRHGFRGDFPALLRWWLSGPPVAASQ